MQLLQKLFPQLHSFEFDDNAAEFYARICVDLTVKGNLIGANDLMITAIARANNATLITHKTTGELSRVKGLLIKY